jgi:outer membrane protein assembly factor BamB
VLGPDRDGHARGVSVKPWDKTPAVRWRHRCGAGYAGVAVAADRVYLWHREDDREVIECLSAADGSRLWSRRFPAIYSGGVDPDRGPRCVPVVTPRHVVLYGAAGDLHVLDAARGTLRWTRQLRSELEAGDGYFGAGSTPLVLEDRVLVEVGARDGAGLVAVALEDGRTLWKRLDSEASYASPVRLRRGDQTLVIAPMRLETVLVDPRDGRILSRVDFGRRGPSVVAATPLVDGQRSLLTASYGVGCRMIDWSAEPPRNLWDDTDVISSQYATPIRVGDIVLAVTGREDFSNAGLVCSRWEDGGELWAEPDYGTAHMIATRDGVISVGVDGRLDLIEPRPDRFSRLASCQLPEGSYRSLPALAGGTLFLRRTTSPSRGELIALEVAP